MGELLGPRSLELLRPNQRGDVNKPSRARSLPCQQAGDSALVRQKGDLSKFLLSASFFRAHLTFLLGRLRGGDVGELLGPRSLEM